MLKYVKKPRNITQYTLMRGVTDFGNLHQYDLFEKGYSFLTVISIPKFMEKLAEQNADIKIIVDNFVAILEYEFRGLDGLGDIQGEQQTVGNGIDELSLITKVKEDASVEVTMEFTEKSGATITKFMELFLKGIKDSRSQAKRYHGLIEQGILESGYENEVFTLLFYVTDNTYRNLERAYLLLCAQPTKAETSIYNANKSDIGSFATMSVGFTCFPVTSDEISRRAQEMLDFILSEDAGEKRVILDSSEFNWTGTDKITPKA